MKKTLIVTMFETIEAAQEAVDEFMTIIQKGDGVEIDPLTCTVSVELNTDDVHYARELLKEFMSNIGDEKFVLVLDGRFYEEEAHQDFFYIIAYDMVAE